MALLAGRAAVASDNTANTATTERGPPTDIPHNRSRLLENMRKTRTSYVIMD